VTFDFQSDFTGSQFVIKQTTGNPTTGVLFDIEVADANVKAFQATDSAGDGVELSISGNLVVVGSGNIDASRVNYDGDVIAEITSNGTNIQFDPNDDSSTNWIMTTSALQGFTAGAASVANLDSTATVPNILSDKTDTNTGMGASAADQISLIAGAEEILRISDAGDVASGEAVRFSGAARATPADADEAYLSLLNYDSTPAAEEFSRISWIADDVTTTEEDGSISFDVRVAGSLVEGMRLQGDGVDSTQLNLPVVNDAANPTLAFGGDSGFYEAAGDWIGFTSGGTASWIFSLNAFQPADTGASLRRETPSATNPTLIPDFSDSSTGVASGGSTQVSLVANSAEVARGVAVPNAHLAIPTYVAIGSVDRTAAACIDNDGSDRLYHDTDCDNTKDGGENFIDIAARRGLLGGTDEHGRHADKLHRERDG
jgi:hypothetical protein